MATPAVETLKAKPVSYSYVALSEEGALVRGLIKAANEAVAGDLLDKRGLKLVSIELAPSAFSPESLFPTLFKIKPREVIIFSRQIATLMDSGITLLPALELLQGQEGIGKPFKKLLGSIINDIRTGASFSDAVTRRSDIFGDIYCRTVATGEQTGELQSALRQMVEHLEKQGVVTKKVAKALSYPAMIGGLGVIVVIVLMTTALPPLIDMFVTMNVALPLPTRIVIFLTKFIGAYKMQMAAVVFLVVLLGTWYIKQPAGRRLVDRIAMSVPVIGPPTHMAEIARFSRTLSVLIVAGLPLQEILQMMPQTTNNTLMRDAVKRVHQGLLLGQGLSGPMSQLSIFPPLLVQMVAVGEESNTLVSTLKVVTDFYEAQAEEKIAALVAVIQPLATITVALMVAFIAISIIMPMYTITGAFG